MEQFDSDSLRADKFLELSKRYTDFSELTAPTLHAFVEKVVVHEADRSSGKREQQVDIHLNFIGQFDVPDEAIGCGFHEAVRGVLSHHLVIKDKKIANYHPYPPTPWNGSPRDSYGTPGPYEDAVQEMPIFEENGPDNFKGVDIMRAVRSFDPCLPCGVHMYLGNGNVVKKLHSPMFGETHG